MSLLNQMRHHPFIPLNQPSAENALGRIMCPCAVQSQREPVQPLEDEQLKEQFQAGFSLMELMGVIVMLGILAAIAMPSFKDNQKAAMDAQAKSLSGAIEVASINNRLAFSLKSPAAVSIVGTKRIVCTNTQAEKVLGSPIPSGVTISPDPNGSMISCYKVNNSFSVSCSVVVTGSDGTESPANFAFYCAD